MSAKEGDWDHLETAPFGEVRAMLMMQDKAVDKAKRQRDELIATCRAMLDRMTDGREEADAATLEEWSAELVAAIARARR